MLNSHRTTILINPRLKIARPNVFNDVEFGLKMSWLLVCHQINFLRSSFRLLRMLPVRLQQVRLWLRVQREDMRHQLLSVRSLHHQHPPPPPSAPSDGARVWTNIELFAVANLNIKMYFVLVFKCWNKSVSSMWTCCVLLKLQNVNAVCVGYLNYKWGDVGVILQRTVL